LLAIFSVGVTVKSIEIPHPVQLRQAPIARREFMSQLFGILGLVCVLVAVVALLGLITQMALRGLPRFNLQFFTSFPSSNAAEAGILSAWVGTTLVMIVTVFIAVPVGVAAGLYLEEYARKNWIAGLIEINVTNLAGVPSIVYGLLALGFFNQALNLGESVLTAGLTLALLILPVVIVTTREALRAIPNTLREAAYALGASKWHMLWDHILPYALGSILTGVILGLSRAIGETAPLITIGALTFIAFLPPPLTTTFPFFSVTEFLKDPLGWLKAPFTVMPIQMFNWVSRPDDAFQLNAAAAGTVLITMTLLMNGLAIYLRYHLRRGLKW
jgi:phosphate transport system permease protein